MKNALQIVDTDRLLDELETAAKSSISNVQFYDQLLSSLRLLVHSESASIVVQVQSERWISVALSGTDSKDCLNGFINACNEKPQSEYLSATLGGLTWFGIPIQTEGYATGCIMLTFSKPLPPSGQTWLAAICKAFAEVLEVRQLSRLEKLFSKNWAAVNELTQKVTLTNSMRQAGTLIVNQLAATLSAARVSIAERTGLNSKLAIIVAVSGAGSIDLRSRHIAAIEGLAATAMLQSQPIFRQFSPESGTPSESNPGVSKDGTFKNLLAIQFSSYGRQGNTGRSAIILEWTTQDEMLEAVPGVTHFIPIVSAGWQQQQRWLKLPRFARAWSDSVADRLPRVASRLIRLLVVAIAIGLAFWLLIMPTTLTIEAEATLEPVERRAIFASADGFLDTLFVEDGQNVKEGQPIATLRSPTLDLQIEEVAGQIRATGEKRNGLRVAINQVSSTTPDSVAVQTRISTDILLLDTQEKQAREKLTYLTQERKKLAITSPIDGVVVSRDLRKELESRPLRRGDSLFSVADLDGAWQLNIHVSDRDSGYMLRYYSTRPQTVSFVFDSLPSESFTGEVRHIANTMENPKGTGCHLQVLASLEPEVAKKSHMGANAKVYFSCGQQPLWFVWCRPMIEAVQKRVWLFANNKD